MTARQITTAAELDAVPARTPVRDRYGDVGVVLAGKVHYPETAPLKVAYVAKHFGPFVVLVDPSTPAPSEDREGGCVCS